MGDCWIGISLASDSGLIIAARVGKHTEADTHLNWDFCGPDSLQQDF